MSCGSPRDTSDADGDAERRAGESRRTALARKWRTTVLLLVLGFTSGELAAALFALVKSLSTNAPVAALLTPVAYCVWPGLTFGAIVLVPLSRWLRRSWVRSWLSVLVAVVAYWCACFAAACVVSFFGIGAPGSMGPGYPVRGGFLAGFVGAMIVGLWMADRRTFHSLLSAGVAATLVGAGCGLYFSLAWGEWGAYLAGAYNGLGSWQWFAMPFVIFHTLTAAGVSIQLWHSSECMPSEDNERNSYHETLG